MVKLCPKCYVPLHDEISLYICPECDDRFSEDEVICVKCRYCDEEVEETMDGYYCDGCCRPYDEDEVVYYNASNSDDEDEILYENVSNSDDDNDFEYNEPDYDSMVNNGDRICLNCTYWSTSPHGARYGMVCRRNYPTSGPGDSCSDFVQEHYFASYGEDGQYQFNETGQRISSKLYYWKNSR